MKRTLAQMRSGQDRHECDADCAPLGYDEKIVERVEARLKSIPFVHLTKEEQQTFTNDLRRCKAITQGLPPNAHKVDGHLELVSSKQAALRPLVLPWTLRLLQSPTPLKALSKLWVCARAASLPLVSEDGALQPLALVVARFFHQRNGTPPDKWDGADCVASEYFKRGRSGARVVLPRLWGVEASAFAFHAGCAPGLARQLRDAADETETPSGVAWPLRCTRCNDMQTLAIFAESERDGATGNAIFDGHAKLEVALRNRDFGVAAQLVRMGADPLRRTKAGAGALTLLHLAARVDATALLPSMLERCRAAPVARRAAALREVFDEMLIDGNEGVLSMLLPHAVGQKGAPLIDLARWRAAVMHGDGTYAAQSVSPVDYVLFFTPGWTAMARAVVLRTLLKHGCPLSGDVAASATILEWDEGEWLDALFGRAGGGGGGAGAGVRLQEHESTLKESTPVQFVSGFLKRANEEVDALSKSFEGW
jgi:hypothetical protein